MTDPQTTAVRIAEIRTHHDGDNANEAWRAAFGDLSANKRCTALLAILYELTDKLTETALAEVIFNAGEARSDQCRYYASKIRVHLNLPAQEKANG